MIKILLFIYICVLSMPALSFRLNTNTAAHFNSKKVSIFITSNSDCNKAGITKEELLNLAIDGANDFWNRVPTSSLRLKKGGVKTITDNLYTTGELCVSDSTKTCDTNTSVPKSSDIILACNNNATNFPQANILAISGPTNISGSKIAGSVILINNTDDSTFSTLSYNEKRSALAHEIGHAIGLGHSNKNEALMYYKNAQSMNRLAQDDIDGVSYLYPNKLDGCGSFFGGVDLDKNDQGPWSSFLLSICFGIAAFYLFLTAWALFPRILAIVSRSF